MAAMASMQAHIVECQCLTLPVVGAPTGLSHWLLGSAYGWLGLSGRPFFGTFEVNFIIFSLQRNQLFFEGVH